MTTRHRLRILVTSLLAAGGLLRADVLVTTSIDLTNLTITPSAGSIQFVSGCMAADLCAKAFAEALDSLGGSDQQFQFADNGTTSATADTTLANANAAASVPNMTGSASSAVNIAGIAASASSTGRGTLVGSFEIVGAANPVTLQASANFTVNQKLKTDFFAVSGSSETTFTLDISNSTSPLLFFDNLLTVGPDEFTSYAGSPSIGPVISAPLQAGTTYTLTAEVDAESHGVNNAVPEPSALFLLLSAMGALGAIARRAARSRAC